MKTISRKDFFLAVAKDVPDPKDSTDVYKRQMIGAFILGGVEIFVAAFLPSTYRDFVAFALLLVLLIVRPYGILGSPRIQKV